jgi:hypothetical protein
VLLLIDTELGPVEPVAARILAVGIGLGLALTSLSGCYSPAPGAAPNILEVRNDTSAVVHVSWPIGEPPANQQGAFDVPAHGVATYGCGASIDAAFVIDGRTVEQTITSPVTGATIHVVISTNGTVAIASVTTPGP